MPNGYDDRLLLEIIQCIAGFRNEHGSWPTALRVHPDYHDDIQVVFNESSLKPVEGLLEVVADEKCRFVAEDEMGKQHELHDYELKGSEFRDVFNWLFGRSPMASHE